MDMLLSRLTWPSALVRERTAVALADLMSQEGPIGEQARNPLMEWIGQQGLESTAILGILVFCRLADQYPLLLPEPAELDRSIRKPSLLSFDLLRHIYGTAAIKPDWDTCHSDAAPPEFVAVDFFDKYRTNFLPPAYSSNMEYLQSRTRLPMFRQWAFEWTQLITSEGFQPSERVFDFGMRPHGPKMVVDFSVSEAYRSAYLRSLAWAVTRGKLSENDAHFLALDACPIDLGLWRIQPGHTPPWWPDPKSPTGAIHTVPAQVWETMSRLWERRRTDSSGNALLAASGRVFRGSVIYELSIRAMFQVAQGPVPGVPADMIKACEEAHGSRSSHGPCFGGALNPIDPTDINFTSHDWSILPASVFVRPDGFARWQYWRGFGGIQLPAPFLASESLSFRCEPDSVKVFDSTTEVGSWRDWTNGITEEFDDGLTPSHGWALEASWELVDNFIRESNATFGWICELKGLSRANQYEPFREFVATQQMYGTTNLILPQ